MGGGFESKPGGRSLVQSIADAPVGAVSGEGKRTLTEQLGSGAPSGGTTGYVVQRRASSAGAPPPVDPVATA